MAIKMLLVDDIDQSEDAETIYFGLDGQEFEIDLVDKNAVKLRQALEPFIEVARQRGVRNGKAATTKKAAPSRAPRQNPPGHTVQQEAIREWARKNGKKVSSRGRIPRDIMQSFNEAHSIVPAFSG